MRKVLRWIGIVLGSLVGLVVLAVVALYLIGGSRLNKTYDIRPETITIPTDAAAIARGQHLAEAIAECKGCHGDNLGGKAFFEDPALAVVYTPNLTSGRGGVGATYSDADWMRAIRHGADPDGRPLFIMPAEIFQNLSAEDLGAIIAYVRSVPPVDNEIPAPKYGFMGRVLIAAGAFGEVLPVEIIDHSSPFPSAPAPGATGEYGGYLVSIGGCTACHGADLSSGYGTEPGAPLAPNLTPGGELAEWSEADFVQAIRTGVSPHGHDIDPAFMPWEAYAKMTGEELSAVFLYLQSLPVLETTE